MMTATKQKINKVKYILFMMGTIQNFMYQCKKKQSNILFNLLL